MSSHLCYDSSVSMATGTSEVIITVGGEDDKVVLRSVESFDPVTNKWRDHACLPFAVSKHGLVVSGEPTQVICKSVNQQLKYRAG